MSSHASTSKCKGKRSSDHLNNDDNYIPSEIEEIIEVEEPAELESDSEFFQPPTKKQCTDKKSKGKK